MGSLQPQPTPTFSQSSQCEHQVPPASHHTSLRRVPDALVLSLCSLPASLSPLAPWRGGSYCFPNVDTTHARLSITQLTPSSFSMPVWWSLPTCSQKEYPPACLEGIPALAQAAEKISPSFNRLNPHLEKSESQPWGGSPSHVTPSSIQE